ncbi:MAG: transketolase family protein [Clostridia bacterium]|nr:transketolase family protein [Clostridia bacterium]
MEKIAMRDAYGKALAELGNAYDFVVMDADLSGATKTATFKKAFPDRFFDCGIAEGNMMSAAAGIASTGTPVFASSFAMFAAGRAFEQIRNSIGYPHLNVKIAATHAGITVGEDGATHQCNEDIAVMRVIPGMTVLSPADATEVFLCVKAALEMDGPVYIRLSRMASPVLFERDTHPFELGKGITLREGNDVAIAATGLMVWEALQAAETLAEKGINARVIDIHTVKPLDEELLAKAACECGAVVTAEEHSRIGGFGAAVCESLASSCPVPVVRVGINDTFGKSGKAEELMAQFGVTAAHIVAAAEKAVAMKAAK